MVNFHFGVAELESAYREASRHHRPGCNTRYVVKLLGAVMRDIQDFIRREQSVWARVEAEKLEARCRNRLTFIFENLPEVDDEGYEEAAPWEREDIPESPKRRYRYHSRYGPNADHGYFDRIYNY